MRLILLLPKLIRRGSLAAFIRTATLIRMTNILELKGRIIVKNV